MYPLKEIVGLACIVQIASAKPDFDWNKLNPFRKKQTTTPPKTDAELEAEFVISHSVPEIIRHYGFECEEYNATTSDGYILGLQRIVCKNEENAKCKLNPAYNPVYLQHGLVQSSADYIINGGNERSLAFALALEGFDVWLGNLRGSTYARGHKTLEKDGTHKTGVYWNFTWVEQATYDVPTLTDYILKATGKNQVHYMGYSQGGMNIFAAMALSEELRPKLATVHGLAPAVYMGNNEAIKKIISTVGIRKIIRRDWHLGVMARFEGKTRSFFCKNGRRNPPACLR